MAQLQRENVQMRRERGKLASRLAHDHRRQPSDNGSPRRTGGDERRGEGRERTAEELRSTRAELRSKCDQVCSFTAFPPGLERMGGLSTLNLFMPGHMHC